MAATTLPYFELPSVFNPRIHDAFEPLSRFVRLQQRRANWSHVCVPALSSFQCPFRLRASLPHAHNANASASSVQGLNSHAFWKYHRSVSLRVCLYVCGHPVPHCCLLCFAPCPALRLNSLNIPLLHLSEPHRLFGMVSMRGAISSREMWCLLALQTESIHHAVSPPAET